jgi:hypothetical protein
MYSYPRNRTWGPIGLWDVKDSTLYGQSAHRWWQGFQPYEPAALYSPETETSTFSGRSTHICALKGKVEVTKVHIFVQSSI